jgi:hypothetical protein
MATEEKEGTWLIVQHLFQYQHKIKKKMKLKKINAQ